MRAFQDRVRLDLGGPQRGGGVGGEERVAGARREDDDAALLQVAHGPAADVRLRYARHLDRRLHPRGLALRLQRVLEGQRVHDRGQHAHVVALGGVHARAGADTAAPEVAAAHYDGDVDAEFGPHLGDLVGRDGQHPSVEALPGITGQGLARELEHDAAPAGRRALTVDGHPQPIRTWANRVTFAGATNFSTDTFSSLT